MTDSPSHTVPQVLTALSRVGKDVRTAPGASAQTLAAAASAVGGALPQDVLELYRATDGLELARGNLHLYPLLGTDVELGVVEAAAIHRSWDWVIPAELVLLGSDGGDGAFGVWVPAGARRSVVVQAVVSLDERPALAVLGTSLAGFLAAWAAYYLPLTLGETAGVSACLDDLGVPAALREGESELDDEHLHALLAWASPDLPDDEPDPYARPVDPAVLTRLATS
ncbi:SMI1/KNR4 family protein [Ornithinimicrobium pratense]|uniref:SMI1/KNR4 family protein n=1 Tax=Ornithinimicrobium pratense TaxID=2593973 RepID=A0A5J6V8C8_9MICO|nr:SMI1/KNR4 family protein [Ornithinimicrobium pratense]QFG69323.1 SMI1/KNR4 family protein [Ornithinimicrobium pratense]